MFSICFKIAWNFVGPAVEKISRGSQSWPSIRWETELSTPSFLRGESHSQTLKSVKWFWVTMRWVLTVLQAVDGSGGHLCSHKWSVLPFHLRLGVCGVSRWRCFYFREDQVNFRGFMRTLAHFRPIEDNEKNKNPTASEPLNSRTNKLLCEWGSSVLHIHWLSSWVCVQNFSIYVPVAFRLYDLDRDDKISRDELLQVSVR